MNLFFKIVLSLIFIFFIASCKKDKNLLGVDVQPPDDALNAEFSGTAPVYAFTQKYDSIGILGDQYKYLGINKDPYFGTTDVGLYLNTAIPDGQTFISFGDDANLISSEIILTAFNLGESYVGNLGAQVTYSVFPITTALDPTRYYYTADNNFHTTNNVLGAFTGSYTALNGKVVLRIPIDKNFANAILTNPLYLYSLAAFQSAYMGFYIKCSLNNDEGAIMRFDLGDDLSGFYLYYQNGTPAATKITKSYKFVFGSTDNARFNTMKQDFQGANSLLKQQVINKDTTKGADALFLKGMGVTKVKVYIPSIKNYSDSFKVAVNRAEVIFNLDPSFYYDSAYAPPAKLCLLAADSISREAYILDQTNATDAARYDGTFDSENNRYVFNIARHVEAILLGKQKNYGFYLVVGNADNLITYKNFYNGPSQELFLVNRDNYIERVVLAGSNNALLKPVFNLSYVKIRHD